MAKINNQDFAFDDCYKNFSTRCSAKMFWTGCCVKSSTKDRKIEAIHNLLR